jgi:hypothetical protein
MNLKEITDLIAIRQYVVNSTANPAIDRATVNYMTNLLLMLDRKIIALLGSDAFKDYVDYQDVGKVKQEVVKLNDIKSGIRHKL